MELSWSTFVLEIINFLVLVWILQRFLYKPVLAVIDQRRHAIEAKLGEAQKLNDEAQALKDQYGGRLEAWETEKRAAMEALTAELENERARKLKETRQAIEQVQQKAQVAADRKAAEASRAAVAQALRQAAEFSSRILAEACSPALEARLLELLLEELDRLSAPQIASLAEQWGEPPSAIAVTSAWDLTADQQSALEARLRRLSGPAVPIRFGRDPALLAGILIELGAWVIGANVRDELKGFAELSLVGA